MKRFIYILLLLFSITATAQSNGGAGISNGSNVIGTFVIVNENFDSLYVIKDSIWDDIRFPLTGNRIDVSQGRIDYNYEQCGIDFQANARYPEEVICNIVQMQHDYKIGTNIEPHLHWYQNQDEIPNFMIEYRVYNNGDTIPEYTQAAWSKIAFEYTVGDGTILQIIEFPSIDMSSINGVSSFVDIRFFRDSQNTSGLFLGVSPYSGIVTAKEFDIHYMIDGNGSDKQYSKSW